MRKPEITTGKWAIFCAWAVGVSDSWAIRWVVQPVFVSLPIALLAAAIAQPDIAKQLSPILGIDVPNWLSKWALPLFLASYLLTILSQLIAKAIKDGAQPEKELTRDHTIAILRALDKVTGDKAARFGDAARKLTTGMDGATAFRSITKPDQQMILLVSAIRGIFETLDQSSNYRVGLLGVRNGKPTEWICYEPQITPPRTRPEDLCSTSSTAMCAIRAKKPVLVGDITKELSRPSKRERRFVRGSHRTGDEGSLLCYPIISHGTDVSLIIAISGNRADCMPEKHLPLYEWVIEPFALRLSLEHSLSLIKEHVSNVTSNP